LRPVSDLPPFHDGKPFCRSRLSLGVARLLARSLGDREDPTLPNAKFYFDGRGKNREIDVPLCRGRVLVAVQTWASEVDPRMAEGDRKAMKRRWDKVKQKLRDTDRYYAGYLLRHPDGRRRMEEEGLRYVLPVVCSPFTEPVASLKPGFWLRPLSARSPAEAERALPRASFPQPSRRAFSPPPRSGSCAKSARRTAGRCKMVEREEAGLPERPPGTPPDGGPAAAPGLRSAVPDFSGAETDARLVELWLTDKAPETRRQYAQDLERFSDFAGGKPFSSVTLADLQEFAEFTRS
jgi:hypothetical protein